MNRCFSPFFSTSSPGWLFSKSPVAGDRLRLAAGGGRRKGLETKLRFFGLYGFKFSILHVQTPPGELQKNCLGVWYVYHLPCFWPKSAIFSTLFMTWQKNWISYLWQWPFWLAQLPWTLFSKGFLLMVLSIKMKKKLLLKKSKNYTLFMTNTAEKPSPFGAACSCMAHITEQKKAIDTLKLFF